MPEWIPEWMPALGNFSWVDTLLIVLVLALVATRFFKFKLPWDTRPKAERKGWREVVEKFQQPRAPEAEAATPARPNKSLALRNRGPLVVPKGLTGLAALKAVDPSFSEATFIKGAKEAYLYFHDKWVAKDEDGLANICAPRLLDQIIDERAPGKASEVKAAKITSARLNGRTAIVEVDFEAKHGSKNLKSRWTLARAVGNTDPNWELQDFSTRK